MVTYVFWSFKKIMVYFGSVQKVATAYSSSIDHREVLVGCCDWGCALRAVTGDFLKILNRAGLFLEHCRMENIIY